MASDVEVIRALIHRYAELIDAGDLDRLAALFANATWRSSGRGEVLRGSAQVREAYDGVLLHEDGTPSTQHLITNVTVEVDGDGATARSYFTVIQARPDFPLQPIVSGRYEDAFERVDGTWRFADRLIVPMLIGDVSRHLAGVQLSVPNRPG
jgi:3-phenylpropionate/cinnamic acid dioxygenase small subunit